MRFVMGVVLAAAAATACPTNETCLTAGGEPTTLCQQPDSNCTSGERYATQVVSIHGTPCHNWTWACVPPPTAAPTALPTTVPTTVPTPVPTTVPTPAPTTAAPTTVAPTTAAPTAAQDADDPDEWNEFYWALTAVLFVCLILACLVLWRVCKTRERRVVPANRTYHNPIYSV